MLTRYSTGASASPTVPRSSRNSSRPNEATSARMAPLNPASVEFLAWRLCARERSSSYSRTVTASAAPTASESTVVSVIAALLAEEVGQQVGRVRALLARLDRVHLRVEELELSGEIVA